MTFINLEFETKEKIKRMIIMVMIIIAKMVETQTILTDFISLKEYFKDILKIVYIILMVPSHLAHTRNTFSTPAHARKTRVESARADL